MNYKSGILSFFLTGLGQFRNGSLVKGLVFMFVPFLALLAAQLGWLGTFSGMLSFIGLFLVWKVTCIIDALRNKQNSKVWYNKPIVLGLILAFWFCVPLFGLIKEFRKYSTYGAYRVPTSSMKSTLYIGDCFISKNVSPDEINRGDLSVFIYPDNFSDQEVHYIKRCMALPGDKFEIADSRAVVNGQGELLSTLYQNSYEVQTSSFLNKEELNDMGIEEFELSATEGTYLIYCTPSQAKQVENNYKVISVVHSIESIPSYIKLFGNSEWNVDNYGPIVVPKKGEAIALSDSTRSLYANLILGEGGQVYKSSYTFKKDYFFMLGDNRKRSADSRYWGFVPAENIVSKPLYLYWSKDKSRIGLDLTK
jgi:signal peptidase I